MCCVLFCFPGAARRVILYNPENASDTVLRLTHSSEKGSMLDQTAECFRKKLEMISGGRLQVEIYPDNTLGKLEKALSFGNGRVDLRLGVTGASYSNIIMWKHSISQTLPCAV